MSEQVPKSANNGQSTAVVLAVCDDLFGQAVAEAAVRYKWTANPVFHIVFIVDLGGLPSLAPQLVEDIEKDEYAYGQKLVGTLSSKLKAALPECEIVPHLIDGTAPARLILDVADATQAGMIILGSHGRTGLKKLVLGSVSSQVVANAKCSTLVVRVQHGEEVTSIPGPPGMTVADLPSKMVAYTAADDGG